jgi:tetratricopeptide (TPR) repeat protein
VPVVSEGSPHRPYLSQAYENYLDSQDTAGFVRRVAQFYTQGTLERLVDHDSSQVRRGAVLALGFLGDYSANASLGRALQDEDRTVRTLAENSIRNVWTRVGTDKDRRMLGLIVRLNSAQQFETAIDRATKLLEQAAWFAEVWNQRAIANFSLGRYQETIRDCHQALEINPYHFGAAAGMGQAYLELGNRDCALESFRRALRLNPDLEAVRVQVARLVRLPRDQ